MGDNSFYNFKIDQKIFFTLCNLERLVIADNNKLFIYFKMEILAIIFEFLTSNLNLPTFVFINYL